MNVPSLPDQLRFELLKRRLPRYYVHRVLRELTDHSHDIAAESAPAEADWSRLGEPHALADRFAAEYRARHFAGRHPWLTFLLAPIPCTILTAAFLYAGLFFAVDRVAGPHPLAAASWLDQFLAIIVCHGGVLLPIVAVMFGFGRLAMRSGCGLRWLVVVGVLQCTLTALVHTHLRLPTMPGNGFFSIGLSFPADVNWLFVMLPLLTALATAWHGIDRSRPAQPHVA